MEPLKSNLSSKLWCLLPLFIMGCLMAARAAELPFDRDWKFLRDDVAAAVRPDFDDRVWETVTLPHTAHLEALADGQGPRQWQGVCWYRKTFELPPTAANQSVLLRFEGAMNVAEIWVNGQSAGQFMGGYLPYVLDISRWIHPGTTNLVAVRLDNRDNPVTGPKPLADLDFNLYGGLYRSAHLILTDKLHITDPILANQPAGGGVFVTFSAVSATEAIVQVKTDMQNDGAVERSFSLRTTLLDKAGNTVASQESLLTLVAGANESCAQKLTVSRPQLWSPDSPYLYTVRSELVADGKVVDVQQTRVGIREIRITNEGFYLNGQKRFLRGCNRHQEYPYIGNALSDAAQYRDALKIKEAGFDYVRLSHYPQSPAFLDACDELGLVVMDGILGWQYFNRDPRFAAQKYLESRQLIRRDRNHPSVILWELSLNESSMPAGFIKTANAIGHEEYPGDQCYTAGWMRGYDVYLQARQHGGCHGVTNVPCLVSEYGDWEYYAQNAGLDQGKWKDLKPAERSSRQLRGDGEVRMLQQALNFQEAHNDDLQTPAFADGIWAMFDYSRGYAPDLESSGVMDVFRLPKFSTYFFRSQRDADELVAGKPLGPQVFIANYWATNSPTEVRVFSNCEAVELFLNGRLVERRRPDASRLTTRLKHPPFTFNLPRFEAGQLKAVGYIGSRAVATDERQTPQTVTQLTLQFDLGGKPFAEHGQDVAFCRAGLVDAHGTPCPENGVRIIFGTTGQLKRLGTGFVATEAGIATALVAGDQATASDAVYALGTVKSAEQIRLLAASGSPGGQSVPIGAIHYTTDGTEPTLNSAVYTGPIAATSPLRAAIFVQGKKVAMIE